MYSTVILYCQPQPIRTIPPPRCKEKRPASGCWREMLVGDRCSGRRCCTWAAMSDIPWASFGLILRTVIWRRGLWRKTVSKTLLLVEKKAILLGVSDHWSSWSRQRSCFSLTVLHYRQLNNQFCANLFQISRKISIAGLWWNHKNCYIVVFYTFAKAAVTCFLASPSSTYPHSQCYFLHCFYLDWSSRMTPGKMTSAPQLFFPHGSGLSTLRSAASVSSGRHGHWHQALLGKIARYCILWFENWIKSFKKTNTRSRRRVYKGARKG